MTEDDDYYYWPRGEITPLNRHFTTREFSCHCQWCTDQRIAKDLVSKLFLVRASLGHPFSITSGYRCHEHQEALKAGGYETAVGVSQHELGRAADIRADVMSSLLVELKHEFKAIGVASTFIHVDLRDDKERHWAYARR